MGRESFSNIGTVLKNLMERRKSMQNVGKELRIWEEWDKAVGTEIAKNARPIEFRAGVLLVETKHPLWATELQFRGETIRSKLNQLIGDELVQSIRYRTSQKLALNRPGTR